MYLTDFSRQILPNDPRLQCWFSHLWQHLKHYWKNMKYIYNINIRIWHFYLLNQCEFNIDFLVQYKRFLWLLSCWPIQTGWVVLWWAPSAKSKDHHGVSSGWSSTWFRSNTGRSSTQYEQIPIIFGVWPFGRLHFFSVNNILVGLWLNCISSVQIIIFLLVDILLQHRALSQCSVVLVISWVIADSLCKLIQSLFLQWFLNWDFFVVLCFNSFFFLKLIVACKLCVIYVREDNDSNVWAVITNSCDHWGCGWGWGSIKSE